MTQSSPAGEAKPKPPRDPFGPRLEPAHVNELFCRLETRPPEEQRAFVAKINWNLLDEASEYRLIGWLIDNLRASDPERQVFVVKLLDKLPHFRRARYTERFKRVLPALEPQLATQVADAFGPVLGGAPKRSAKSGAAQGGSKPIPHPPKQPPAPQPAGPPKEASTDELSKLKDFFGKFGGAR